MPLDSTGLLARDPTAAQLALVLGKGGVGRSTVACALALAAGRAGRRTALVEVHGSRTLATWWGQPEGPQQGRAIAPGVDLWSLSARGCLAEYGMDRFGSKWLTDVVFGGRVMRALLDAIPGMDDLLHLGRINRFLEDEEDPYELVVIDGPATGHGLAFYRTAGTMAEMAGRGPMYEEARRIADRLADPARTALVLTTLAEELPVNESGELADALRADGRTVQLVVANQVLADPFTAVPWDRVRPVLEAAGQEALAASGERLAGRLGLQRAALAELGRRIPEVPVVHLGWVAEAHEPEGLSGLAEQLGAS